MTTDATTDLTIDLDADVGEGLDEADTAILRLTTSAAAERHLTAELHPEDWSRFGWIWAEDARRALAEQPERPAAIAGSLA